MKKVVFNELKIFDINKEEAVDVVFNEGINVVTSNDNHVGKSVIIKSLYYSMGAEVFFADRWDKDSKIYCTNFSIDNNKYKIVRFLKQFILFCDNKLILSTDKVTKELAKKYEELFDFGIYLKGKSSQKTELAPPAFLFLPYYIDQDRGWSTLYNSFLKLEQFDKKDRMKSLYYHLRIYDKKTIELLSLKNELTDRLKKLENEINNYKITMETINTEVDNIIPTSDLEELEKNLQFPKEKIEKLISLIGNKRNEIQKQESILANHKYQLDILSRIQGKEMPFPEQSLSCPNCGYTYEKELVGIVQKNISNVRSNYLITEIENIIKELEENLQTLQKEYIALSEQLKNEEIAYHHEKNEFDIYVTQKGLHKTISSITQKINNNELEQSDVHEKIKDIEKELKTSINKDEVENCYSDFVKKNLMMLHAWQSNYPEKIKVLEPLNGQGSLINKTLLSQYIALFQTMKKMDIKNCTFPFLIDSPRGNEASSLSSIEIMNLITQSDFSCQTIVSTIEFDSIKSQIKNIDSINIIKIETDPFHLLNDLTYTQNEKELLDYIDIFNIKKN